MPTADGQLHADEFIGEVIGIDRLRHLDFDLTGEDFVLVAVSLGEDLTEQLRFHGFGRTIGFALADARQKIRDRYGR